MANFGKMVYYDLTELEAKLGRVKMRWFVRESEADFLRTARELADRAAWNPKIKAILISGPSSSGKTTFTERLAGALHLLGRPTATLNMDNYYKEDRPHRDAQGRPDFESASTLELDLFADHVRELSLGRAVGLPSYDFVARKRSFPPELVLRNEPRGIILVEGLHALSDEVSSVFPDETCLRVFIMPYATLISDQKLLTPRDIRVLRRISRDSRHRGTRALATLDYWPVMDAAEEAVFPDYLAKADLFINSAMPYEFFVIPPLAGELLKEELRDRDRGTLPRSTYLDPTAGGPEGYADFATAIRWAENLLRAIEEIPTVSPDIVPEISILNEFMK